MSQYRIKKFSKYCSYKRDVQDFYAAEYKLLGLFWININWNEPFCDRYIFRTEEAARERIEAHKATKISKVDIIEVD